MLSIIEIIKQDKLFIKCIIILGIIESVFTTTNPKAKPTIRAKQLCAILPWIIENIIADTIIAKPFPYFLNIPSITPRNRNSSIIAGNIEMTIIFSTIDIILLSYGEFGIDGCIPTALSAFKSCSVKAFAKPQNSNPIPIYGINIDDFTFLKCINSENDDLVRLVITEDTMKITIIKHIPVKEKYIAGSMYPNSFRPFN